MFRKYQKITSRVQNLPDLGGEWVAVEKVHGANLSLYTDGTVVKVGKRNSALNGEEATRLFYNSDQVLKEHSDKLLELFKLTNAKERLTVYGELFGGEYPHTEVKSNKKYSRIQKDIYYSPDRLFYPFDILVDAEFLAHDEAVELYKAVGFSLYAKDLYRGSFNDVYTRPVHGIITTIPQQLGLPEIENNVWEGVIIRKNERFSYHPNRSEYRPVLKKKTAFMREFGSSAKEPVVADEDIKGLDQYLTEDAVRAQHEAHPELTHLHLRNLTVEKCWEAVLKDRPHYSELGAKKCKYIKKRMVKMLVPIAQVVENDLAPRDFLNHNRVVSARTKLGPQASIEALKEEVINDGLLDYFEMFPHKRVEGKELQRLQMRLFRALNLSAGEG